MLRLLGYFWLFVIFVTTIFEYFWVFWEMQGYFQLFLELLTIMGNFWEFFIHLGKYWDILGTIGYYYGTHGYFCVVFGIGCVALCAQQLRTQHQADHAKPTMRRAPCSRQHFCSVENRVDAAVIPGPGHGPARGREPREEDPLGDQQEQPRELRHRSRSWASRDSLDSRLVLMLTVQFAYCDRVLVQCPQTAGSLRWTSPGAQQENRVHAAVIPGPGHGPARAQQEDLEKKIPLVTRRSSLESSVIGLEVGQVDQGKRVLVQYIYYNLIISVFNN